MFPRLHLAVFHVSGDSTRQWEFQTSLPRFSFRHPDHLQGKHINPLGDAGVAGVLRESLILFQHLLQTFCYSLSGTMIKFLHLDFLGVSYRIP